MNADTVVKHPQKPFMTEKINKHPVGSFSQNVEINAIDIMRVPNKLAMKVPNGKVGNMGLILERRNLNQVPKGAKHAEIHHAFGFAQTASKITSTHNPRAVPKLDQYQVCSRK
jgi:hypothetical protein